MVGYILLVSLVNRSFCTKTKVNHLHSLLTTLPMMELSRTPEYADELTCKTLPISYSHFAPILYELFPISFGFESSNALDCRDS